MKALVAILSSLVALLATSACDDTSDRPICSVHCIDAGGDADADADADADTDGDGDLDCFDPDNDSFTAVGCEGGEDCAEGDPAVHPGAAEVCNGLDDDCDGEVDEELLQAGVDVVLPAAASETILIQLVEAGDGFGLIRLERAEDSTDLILLLQRLDGMGQPVGQPITLSNTPDYLYTGSVALVAVGDGFVAAWSDVGAGQPGHLEGTLEGAHIDAAGSITSFTIGPDPGVESPSLTSGSDTILALWTLENVEVHYLVLRTATLEPVAGGVLTEDGPVGRTTRPAAMWTGDRFVVASADLELADSIWTHAIDEEGTVVAGIQIEAGELMNASVAWNGFEGAIVYNDLFVTGMWFRLLDADGFPTTGEVDLGAGKTARMVGSPRAFGLARVVGGAPQNWTGSLEFIVLGSGAVSTNRFSPSDTGGTASDAWPALTDGGWALAWIEDDTVHFDRIVCP